MTNSPMGIVHRYDGLTAVKEEDSRPSQAPPQQPPQPRLLVKSEPLELPLNAQPQHQQQLKEPEFVKSIKELGNLSAAIDTFMRKYNELHQHLNFIQSAIDSRSGELVSRQQSPPEQQKIQANTAITPIVTKNKKQPETVTRTAEAVRKAPETARQRTSTTTTTTTTDATGVGEKSELRSLCEMMCGKGLRRYIITNRANTSKLREEVPSALKLAPKPAKLVLDSIGRFYLQGIRAYSKDSPMIPAREASVLCLELFLLMIDGNDVAMDADVKREAEQAAVSWWKRLISEGGLSRASKTDARGLLFLVGCYGIPKIFSNQDIWDLVLSSDSKPIMEPLRKSRVLAARVSDIIERMMKRGMRIEAVGVASTFGFEDKFPLHKILSSFLREASESLKDRRRNANNLPIKLQEANIKHLDALKSVMKFLEDRKLDPAKILPASQIKENIIELEKNIADLDKIVEDKTIKRKAEDIHSSNNYTSQETKHQRFSGNASPLITPGFGVHKQRVAGYADGQILYDNATRINLLDSGYSVHLNNHPAAPYGSSMHSLPENDIGTMAGGRGVIRTPGVGLSSVYGTLSAASSAGVGRSAVYDSPPTGSSAGVHREMLVDRAGQRMGNQGPPYGWHGYGDAAVHNGSLGQTFIRQPPSGLYGSSLSTERFPGLPNSSPAAAANRSSASDLYGFVDQT